MKKFLFVVSLVIAFISCAKIENEPNVEISTNLIKAPSDVDYFPFILVKANEDYTVETNCNWVVINDKVTENGHDRITLKCFMNPTKQKRATTIDIKGEKFYKTVNVIQEGREYKIVQTGDSLYVNSVEAGYLYRAYKEKILNKHAAKEYGIEIWNDVKKITIEGVTNAMDYACIKYNFRNVEHVDLSNTTVEYYKGSSGTLDWGEELEYNADEIPKQAFYFGWCYCHWPLSLDDEINNGMLYLKSIKLPKSIKKIRHAAFVGVNNLKVIVIPEGVVELSGEDEYQGIAFYRCLNLEKVYLPSTLEYLADGSFMNCYALKEVHIAAKNCPKEKISECGIPMTFGKALDIWNIGDWGLGAGYTIGGDSWTSLNGECYIAKTNATLYVPKGCKENYKEWERYFQKIVEE